jgi:hypothetical protein
MFSCIYLIYIGYILIRFALPPGRHLNYVHNYIPFIFFICAGKNLCGGDFVSSIVTNIIEGGIVVF